MGEVRKEKSKNKKQIMSVTYKGYNKKVTITLNVDATAAEFSNALRELMLAATYAQGTVDKHLGEYEWDI